MKTKLLIIATFAMVACMVYAQTDDFSYLNKAMEKLEAGDCKSALTNYNIYKDLSGKSVPSVEALIAECDKDRVYAIGEAMIVEGKEYKVAYIRDDGKHGFAVRDLGWEEVKGYRPISIPTLKELREVYKNRDKLKFYDIYWSSKGDEYYNTVKNFSTGREYRIWRSDKDAKLLLIHRF